MIDYRAALTAMMDACDEALKGLAAFGEAAPAKVRKARAAELLTFAADRKALRRIRDRRDGAEVRLGPEYEKARRLVRGDGRCSSSL